MQLTREQIESIKAELAQYGLAVVPARKSNPRVKSWKPETQAGRACKAAMLRWASAEPIRGAYSYAVRGKDGIWYAEGSEGFEEAKAWRAREDATAKAS